MSDIQSGDQAACITHYDSLYRENYFAHDPTSSSFDQAIFPDLLFSIAKDLGALGLADIGGGNGLLAKAWRERGGNAVCLDYLDHVDDNFQFFNLSRHAPLTSSEARGFIESRISNAWISTCLDVAEHMDVEHICDFLINLSSLTHTWLILSVSTRPSSQGNRFHSTIFPIESWKTILSEAGFTSIENQDLTALSPAHQFYGATENLVAVSHWTRVNPFRDKNNHQHYLLLKKERALHAEDIPALRDRISKLSDTGYRLAKRKSAAAMTFPDTTFNLHFFQDFSFARSLMDVWPRQKFSAFVRADCIAAPHLMMIENQLKRCGIPFQSIQRSNAADLTHISSASVLMTATEGQENIVHQANSLLVLEARKRGAQTLTFQHGMVIPKTNAYASEVICTWDAGSFTQMQQALSEDNLNKTALLGSVKFLDALLPSDEGAFEFRFGAWTSKFASRVLIALGLHWDSMNAAGESGVISWLRQVIERHPDTLFVIKPHCDDSVIYSHLDIIYSENVILADDLLLISLDWPLSRLLRHCDLLVTTYSTLLLDAAAAGVPCALFPQPDGAEHLLSQQLPVSIPTGLREQIDTLTQAQMLEGSLVSIPPKNSLPLAFQQWFQPSLAFFSNLSEILSDEFEPEAHLNDVEIRGAKTASKVLANLDFSKHCHANMQSKESALIAFLNAPLPG